MAGRAKSELTADERGLLAYALRLMVDSVEGERKAQIEIDASRAAIKLGIEPDVAPLAMTIKELAGYPRVHPSTIYRPLRRDQILGFRTISGWRFHVRSIDEWRSRIEASPSAGLELGRPQQPAARAVRSRPPDYTTRDTPKVTEHV